jgi:hypothetical protein
VTQKDVVYRFRLRIFALAQEMSNVRSACRVMGIHHAWPACRRRAPAASRPRPRPPVVLVVVEDGNHDIEVGQQLAQAALPRQLNREIRAIGPGRETVVERLIAVFIRLRSVRRLRSAYSTRSVSMGLILEAYLAGM